eukprot:187511-Heterocapsa_arctica.AAC.1
MSQNGRPPRQDSDAIGSARPSSKQPSKRLSMPSGDAPSETKTECCRSPPGRRPQQPAWPRSRCSRSRAAARSRRSR